jgi:hypothetical protein
MREAVPTTRNQSPDNRAEEPKGLKWILICAGAGVGLTVDYLFPGWGRPILLTLLIFGSLIGFCRPYWGTPFWMTVIGAFTVHAVLVLRLRPVINKLRMPEVFFCAVAEIALIAIVLTLVFPDDKHSRGGRHR